MDLVEYTNDQVKLSQRSLEIKRKNLLQQFDLDTASSKWEMSKISDKQRL